MSDHSEHVASHRVFDHIWGSHRAAEGWRRYVGANPHTDHTHLSFSWEGARKRTSYWDGTPVHYGSAG